jgi:transposase
LAGGAASAQCDVLALYKKAVAMSSFLGIDVSKAKLDVSLLTSTGCERHTVRNDAAGHEALCAWLAQHGTAPVHACLEATGRYGQQVAAALYAAGHRVSVVNPARIKAFADTLLVRNKTDAGDAALIARYCQLHRPPLWTPPDPARTRLQQLTRRLHALQETRQQERNRLQAGEVDSLVQDSIRVVIACLTDQINQVEQHIHQHIRHHAALQRQVRLLTSIPGIGFKTATVLLAEIPDIRAFASARQLVAYAGLNPQQRQSGSSVKKRTRLSKRGNARLRQALYMPGVVAKRHNPLVQSLVSRMEAQGHCPMSIVAAVMRKLLHFAFGILRSGQPFDPHYLTPQAAEA